jgi:hypothetical protein
VLDSRARLLRAALGFLALEPREPALRLLHRWLDCWRGIGDVVTGMARQGYRLHLTNIEGSTWRSTFSHDAAIAADGSGGETTPCRAVQWSAAGRTISPVSDDTQRDNQLHIHQQSRNCEAPGCTNAGGAFTSERDGRIYEFCSEACRAAFERPTG